MNTDFKVNESLKDACADSLDALRKLKDDTFGEINSKLEYVIGSYEFDKNPVGLHEIGQNALSIMKKFKEQNPRKLSKKVIDKMEKSISKYEKVLAS